MKKAIKTLATCWAAYFVTSYVAYGVSENLKITSRSLLDSKKAKVNGEKPVKLEAKPIMAVVIDNIKEFVSITKQYIDLC